MHPINDIRGTKSRKLEGKRIVLGITGSIAAVECVKLARELARHGAEVIPVMSLASQKIIHPDAIHFATGQPPVTELDGAVKHVELCGQSSGRADLLLIAPSTANTISKIAYGIDDTTVTTMATCALGSGMPVIIVPAMHGSMYDHKLVMENIKKLEKIGVKFVGPRLEENKAKIADIDEIVTAAIQAIGPSDFKKNKILVITGSSKEAIDDVRFISNFSSGKTGLEIALAAHERGADVEVWAPKEIKIPKYMKTRQFTSTKDLEKMAEKVKANIVIVPAAISDYSAKKTDGKISSDKPDLRITFEKAPKILKILRKNKKIKLVGFKLESGVSQKVLEERAGKRMKEVGADIMVANLLQDVKSDTTKAIILTSKKRTKFEGTKKELADAILDAVSGL